MTAKRTDHKGRVLRLGESQRENLTYMYRYQDKWGKRQCIYAPTLSELREKEKLIIVDESKDVKSFNNITLSQMGERVCELYEHRKEKTRANILFLAKLVNKHPIANKKIRDIKVSETKLWLMSLANEGIAPCTVRKVRFFCRYACKLAVEDNLIAKNPFDYKIDFLPPENKRDALTPEEQESFLEFLEEYESLQYYKDIILILLETGLRFGELRGLCRSDVDLENRIISVTHQLKGNGPRVWYIDEPKTKAGIRQVPISDRALPALERMCKREEEANSGIEIDGYTGFITLGNRNSIVSTEVMCVKLRKLCEMYEEVTGEPIHVTPHILRHTFCTNMCNRGLSGLALQYIMGHSSLFTTYTTYCHSNASTAIAEFNQLFNGQAYTKTYTNSAENIENYRDLSDSQVRWGGVRNTSWR